MAPLHVDPFRPRTRRLRFLWLAGALLVAAAACSGERPDEDREPVHETPAEPAESATRPEAAAPGLAPWARPDGTSAPARGLWVLAEGSFRVLDDPDRIPRLLDRAEALGASDLFVQVYRGGRVFFRTPIAIERAPSVPEVDVLGMLLEAAHARGLRVHAWVNVLSLSTRRNARLIEELGREAVLVDRLGRSLLDYPDLEVPPPDRDYYRMGTRGVSLDPGVPEVRARIVALFRDLVSGHPDLDGLHLDYIRHPGVLPFSPGSRFGVGLEFGYGATSRARYRAETGRPDPIEGAAPGVVRDANAWDDWRRAQVTALVEEISAATRAVQPELILSAAVIAYVDRAYLTLAQDWRQWLETGAIDLAMPMVYTLDDRLLRYQLESFAGWSYGDRIWPGIGVWLFAKRPARALEQLAHLRANGFSGEMLFSDDALAESPALLAALSRRDAPAGGSEPISP